MFSYEEARNFIEQTTRFGSVLGLTSMRALMEELGNPQNDISIIHIAGTNGKGSVGTYMAAVFREAGLTVGRYCSPAVFEPLECWQYNDRNITKEEYAFYLSQVKSACDIVTSKGIQPTVFEVETALAFVYFKAMHVDVLLLETGLGGETDATNVVERPLACVFTTISRDHMQFLGETLREIAMVKAGIMKPNALVFSVAQEPEVCAVLNQKFCAVNDAHQRMYHDADNDEHNAKCNVEHINKGIDECNKDRQNDAHREIIPCYVEESALQLIAHKPEKLTFAYKGIRYTTQMSGLYQMKNAALAIEVCDKILQKPTAHIHFSTLTNDKLLDGEKRQKTIVKGIQSALWHGRFEVLGKDPLFIIDGAHNEDAVKQLAITIEKSFTNQPLNFIIGILADKEHEKMLEIMMPFANKIYTVTPPNPRGLDGKVLAEEVKAWHEDVLFCETIEEAITNAISQSRQDGCSVLAFGSLSYLGKLKESYKILEGTE